MTTLTACFQSRRLSLFSLTTAASPSDSAVSGICSALSQHHHVLPGLLVQARADAKVCSIHGSISLKLKHQ
jgi:hypothetical protein